MTRQTVPPPAPMVMVTSGVPSSTRVPLAAFVVVLNPNVPATFEVLQSSTDPKATGGVEVVTDEIRSDGPLGERPVGVEESAQAIAKAARATSSGSFLFVIVIHL
jgi:hypothetical protein